MLRIYGIPFFYKQPTLIMENGQKTIEYIVLILYDLSGLTFLFHQPFHCRYSS